MKMAMQITGAIAVLTVLVLGGMVMRSEATKKNLRKQRPAYDPQTGEMGEQNRETL